MNKHESELPYSTILLTEGNYCIVDNRKARTIWIVNKCKVIAKFKPSKK